MFVAVGGSTVADIGPAQATERPILRLSRFLGEQRLPHKMQVAGTTLGGLSGIDRDPRTGTWYFISDDRGRYQPARFYTGRMDFNSTTGAFTGLHVDGVTVLRRPNGTPYPSYGQPGAVDPEAIRYDRWTQRLLWAQEGDRPDTAHPNIPVSEMSVRWSAPDGRHLGGLHIPRNLQLTTTQNGPRRNFGFEGLTFTPRRIAAILEGPRYEDGEPPTINHGAATRITVWNRKGRPLAQYAYQLDALPASPIPPTGRSDSGVTEILAINNNRFLALERSWIEGLNYRVRLYEINLRKATNVLELESLSAGKPYRPVAKRLIHDFGSQPQNLESMAWGPRLRDGECTLVVGSDDNFDEREITRFMAYAVSRCPIRR
ncbi:esterase-like activity of phytase family protein [Acrocarpospora catenulata]|uniref:esterase-like activity of phytase family protein n=1 Tax=Acrocarpospora catenulata TaxID=2836182 RepID=UPI0027E06816|nr:esterase-like activity of phytase family protein [Acrocarpospora catenulata]